MSLSDSNPFDAFLEKMAYRSPLGAEEREAILALPGHPVQVRCNHDFVRLGERVDHACLVVDGLIGRFGQNRRGDRQITAVYIPGDMADLHSVVVPDARSALQALTVTTIMKVPHHALRDVARRYPAIAEAFWRECVIDAAILSEWVVNVGRRDAKASAAHLLCEMACRYEEAGKQVGFTFEFPATQTHLGDMLALTSVHVNRTLKALRDEEVAHVRDGVVRVLDWQRLIKVGEFDPSYLQIAPPAEGSEAVTPIRAIA